MLTFVVMPCLDERRFVIESAASLGFSATARRNADAQLIAVDNGSIDGTFELLHDLAGRSSSPVHVVFEEARGFVPPRRRGVVEAERIARSLGVSPEEVLILQADADTLYREHYAATMQAAARNAHGALLEGSTKPPVDFAARHEGYVAAQRMVDVETDPLDAEDEDEVVVDDKVCGYRLSDYLTWGGLFEEFTDAGDAIHAETTRMFIRARIRHAARKIRVNPAGAIPSRRKVFAGPWLQYATVGFPREASWIEGRMADIQSQCDLDAFATRVLEGAEAEAVRLRRAHQLLLFRYLPALVAEAEGAMSRAEQPRDVADVLTAMPPVSVDELANSPGRCMVALLRLADQRRDLFCTL